MELVIFILVIGAFGFAIYKLAKSKNREPINWLLLCLIISPPIILIILAFMKKLPRERTRSISKSKKKGRR